MGLFNNKKVGFFSDVIRCDEPSYLIWKWRPEGVKLGEHKRENEIRWGSSLRVKDGEVAVFVYRQNSGAMQDFIEGPFDEKLKTSNLPILSGIVGSAFGGSSPFQAEVYFINLAQVNQVKFGVPFFDIYDPRFPDFGVPVAVRGTVSFGIKDYEGFIKLHRLLDFNLDGFQKQIRDAINRYVKDTVANAPAAHNIPVVQIESKIAQINDAVEFDIGERLRDTFGVSVSGVDINAIEIDKSSENYRQLMAITKDITAARTLADFENYAETLRIQREEGQYAHRMQTRTGNLAAYQTEKQAEVGIAGAEALGQMGANGAGDINLGCGGGLNMASLMASMAVGGVVGQNIAGAMNNAMGGTAQPMAAPPPIPTVTYHVAVNGQPTGPYDVNTLRQMAATGVFVTTSLVWRLGRRQIQLRN